MRWIKKTINGNSIDVLEISIIDNDEIERIRTHYSSAANIQISLTNLEHLQLFQHIHTLIITGGIANRCGIETLYALRELRVLVLDYEETDTDEEGIVLGQFPALQYVLSRSNLNIFHLEDYTDDRLKIEVLNIYKNGKPKRIKTAPIQDICIFQPGLFLSTEAHEPASVILMKILNKIMAGVGDFQIEQYSSSLKSISIIPICVPQKMLDDGFCKERKYVSLKRQFADVRLRMDFEEFIHASQEEKEYLCRKNIEQAAKYISAKDKSFRLEPFCQIIKNALSSKAETCGTVGQLCQH